MNQGNPAVATQNIHPAVGALLANAMGIDGDGGRSVDWSRPFSDLGLGPNDVLELVTGIEDELGVAVANSELRPDNLESPAALAALIGGKLASREARKKKLVHLLSEFLPHLSGPQRAVCDFHEQLGRWLDFEVFTYDLDRGLPPRDEIDGLPVSRFAVPRATDLMRLRRRVRAFADHPELEAEQMCNYGLASSEIFRALQDSGADGIVSWFYSGILAQDVVDFFPSKEWVLVPTYFQSPGRREPNPSWWDAGRVDKLVLFQEQDRRQALEWGCEAERITLLPFPVNTDRFRPVAGESRDPDTLLYVGRLTQNKGLRAFLETFRWMVERRRSLELRLVADVDSPSPIERQEVRRLEAAIDALGLAGRVAFAGRKEGEDLVREYSRCAIHILPSIGDCYSFATLEALACGMVCVNLDNPAYEWQRRRDGEDPLVHLCPTLPAMGRKILEILETGALAGHRRYVIENLSWRTLRHAYRDVLLA